MKKPKGKLSLETISELWEEAAQTEPPSEITINNTNAFIQLCGYDGVARKIRIEGKWYEVSVKVI